MFTPSAAFISFQMPEFKSVGGGQDVSHSKLRYRCQQRSVLLFGFDSNLCRFKLYVLLIKMISLTYIHPIKVYSRPTSCRCIHKGCTFASLCAFALSRSSPHCT